MCLLDTKVARAKYVKNWRFSKNQPLFGWLRKNSEKKIEKKLFGNSSVSKLSKKSNHKRFYRVSSEKPASFEPRDLLYPPCATNRKNRVPPSRGDSIYYVCIIYSQGTLKWFIILLFFCFPKTAVHHFSVSSFCCFFSFSKPRSIILVCHHFSVKRFSPKIFWPSF